MCVRALLHFLVLFVCEFVLEQVDVWIERDRKHMHVCHAKTNEHGVDEGALRQSNRLSRTIAQDFKSEEPASLAQVGDLKATSELVLEREHGVGALRDDEAVVDMNDDEDEHVGDNKEEYTGVVFAAKETDVFQTRCSCPGAAKPGGWRM